MNNDLWGIDLGGTKIEGALVRRDQPDAAQVRVRVPTESAKGYQHILDQVARLVAQLEAQSGTKRPPCIGIGTPGNLDPKTRLLHHSNTQCLNGRPFSDDLAAALGTGVHLANDANCLALAEATLGVARGYRTVFGMILGTGVGGGIVIDGNILPGRHGTAGEWGQIVLDPSGPLSSYGTRGTIEAFIAGPGLEAHYERLSGQRKSLREIVALDKNGDRFAAETLESLATRFIQATSIVINLLDPDAIVIGGGVGNIDLLYSSELHARLAQAVFAQNFQTPILKPILGDSAGVFGAAMLVSNG